MNLGFGLTYVAVLFIAGFAAIQFISIDTSWIVASIALGVIVLTVNMVMGFTALRGIDVPIIAVGVGMYVGQMVGL